MRNQSERGINGVSLTLAISICGLYLNLFAFWGYPTSEDMKPRIIMGLSPPSSSCVPPLLQLSTSLLPSPSFSISLFFPFYHSILNPKME